MSVLRAVLARRDGGLLVAGLALIALGGVALVRALLDARLRYAGLDLSRLDRTVLALHVTRTPAGAPLVVGALLVAHTHRRHGALDADLRAAVRACCLVVALLAVGIAAATLDVVAAGGAGHGADAVRRGGWERLGVLLEGGLGGLALAAGALAAAGGLKPAATDGGGAEEDDEAPPTAAAPPDGVDGWVQPPAAVVDAPVAVPVSRPRPPGIPAPGPASRAPLDDRPGNGAGSAAAIEVAVPTAAGRDREHSRSVQEERRRAYAGRLRFSPRREEARALLERLERDPEDRAAAAAFDALDGADRR